MAEPQLFPNEPNVQEHLNKHQSKESGLQPLAVKLTDIATRLKILEERYGTLRKKSQLSEQNIIEADKSHFQNIHFLNENILGVKHRVKELAEKINLLTDEVSHFADKNDLKVLDRYIEFWEPTDFVTRKEINDFLRRKFSEKNN